MRFEFLLLLLALACGCSSNRTAQPLAPELARNDDEAQIEFWHSLPERKAVSNDEAFHGLMLFIHGHDGHADYVDRVEDMKRRRMLPAGFAEPADAPVRRGTFAVALSRLLEVKGGLTMQVFGPSPRYAVRELQYVGLYPPSSPQQTFSGAEFLGIIGRAQDYQGIQLAEKFAPSLVDDARETYEDGGG